jgi:high-affinity nickel-transport protein
MDASLTAALGVGFLLGLRHVTDADHVAAISTLVTQQRSVTHSCLLGAFWGAGHTVALLIAGTATLAVGLTIAPHVERGLELAVACVLIVLGGRALGRTLGPRRAHAHQVGTPGHAHAPRLGGGGRPFLVGLLHGLAGSAALTLLVLSSITRPLDGLLYITVFGIGSTAGMLALTTLIALPLSCTGMRWSAAGRAFEAAAGLGSLGLGLGLAWQLASSLSG